VSLAIGNLFSENNRIRLTDEIEKVKTQALQTPLQGIIASLEGMKVRKDRESLLQQNLFPVLLILGKKDPVLDYEESRTQIDDTTAELISFEDGHMSHIENKEELKTVLSQFFLLDHGLQHKKRPFRKIIETAFSSFCWGQKFILF
jgi:pimeloyl-ACP methyl ester carboxylesterase